MKTKKEKVFTKNGTLFSPNSGKVKKQKNKVFTKNGTLFSPNSSGHLRSDANQSQIIGRDADVDHPSLPPLGFRHPCLAHVVEKQAGSRCVLGRLK